MVRIREKIGITFDDVLLVPQKTTILSRSDVDLSTHLTKNIKLNMPIVSANMDTITEHAMAIELALAGGIGIIHRFLTLEDEVKEVMRVKRHEHQIIDDPVRALPSTKLSEVRTMLSNYGITSVVVVDGKNKLQGIATKRDMMFEMDPDQPVRAFMTPRKKLITATPGISLVKAQDLMRKNKIEKLPLVNKQDEVVGLMTIRDISQNVRSPHAARDGKGRLLVGAAVGVKGDYLERTDALLQVGCDAIVIDIAHGHAAYLIDALKKIKKNFPHAEVIAGNVATYEASEELIKNGADAIKVGIGPGALCTTRIVAGAGVPQITAVIDAVRAAQKKKVPVIADGGIRASGDIVKALAAGASTTMFGTLFFAGCEESPALTFFKNGEKFKLTRGMASLRANQDRQGKTNDVNRDLKEYTAEGVEAIVRYKGPARDIIRQLLGGIRSGFSYCGAQNIEALWKNAEFVRITSNALIESHPHNVKEL